MKKVITFIISTIFLISTAWAGDYISLHHYALDKGFCSDSTNLGGGYKTGYPCTAPYPYRYTRSVQGYKNLYNLTDPKTLCAKDYPDASQCNKTETFLTFSFVNQRIAGANPGTPSIGSFPDGFRIFLPPGTISAGVTLYMPQNADEGVVIRYKNAPENILSYGSAPWESGDSVTLDMLKTRDVYVKNTGGHAFVLPNSSYLPMKPEDSGWIYVRKIPSTSNIIDQISVNIKVNVAAYSAWYKGVQPAGTAGCVDSNKAKTGDKYCWDAGGDPWSANAYVQPVSPPVPVPPVVVPPAPPAPTDLCSPTNLSACKTNLACTNNLGSWNATTQTCEPQGTPEPPPEPTGVKVSIELNLPKYAKPVDIYAGITTKTQTLFLHDATLTTKMQALETDFTGPLSKTISASVDVGSSGVWYVYVLSITTQAQTFDSPESLAAYIRSNKIPYRLQFYKLGNVDVKDDS